MNFFTIHPLFVPIVALGAAEVLKFITTATKKGRADWRDLGRPGGMPSGHATLAASVTTLALVREGPASPLFIITACFTFLFVYDSIKLRWEAGQHAKVLNHLLGVKKLEERLGHTFLEMLTGIFLGTGISFLLLSL